MQEQFKAYGKYLMIIGITITIIGFFNDGWSIISIR